MPIGVYLVGGSKGRPTGAQLQGCLQDPKTRDQLFAPCTPVNNKRWPMIKTNDWYYKPATVSSTTGGAVTGGALGARKRRC